MKNLMPIFLLTLLTSNTFAQPKPGGPPSPPKEAIEACKEKSKDAECEFTVNGKSLKGHCFSPDSSKALACKPAGAP